MPYQPKRQPPGFHKACQAKITHAQYQWVMECAEANEVFPSEVIASLIDDQMARDERVEMIGDFRKVLGG